MRYLASMLLFLYLQGFRSLTVFACSTQVRGNVWHFNAALADSWSTEGASVVSNYNRNRVDMEMSIDANEAIALPNFPLFDALMLLPLTSPLEYPIFLHASLKHTLEDSLAHKLKSITKLKENLFGCYSGSWISANLLRDLAPIG